MDNNRKFGCASIVESARASGLGLDHQFKVDSRSADSSARADGTGRNGLAAIPIRRILMRIDFHLERGGACGDHTAFLRLTSS